MEYDLSLRFLENALAINSKYHGPRSLKVALRYGDCSFSELNTTVLECDFGRL